MTTIEAHGILDAWPEKKRQRVFGGTFFFDSPNNDGSSLNLWTAVAVAAVRLVGSLSTLNSEADLQRTLGYFVEGYRSGAFDDAQLLAETDLVVSELVAFADNAEKFALEFAAEADSAWQAQQYAISLN